ncbi:MAG: acyl carrier protein [Oscillospiraceae bacterium]|nr:acyl carrier protein [Oscillospiraceae bacterium]
MIMKETIYDVIKRNVSHSAVINDDTSLLEIGIDSVEFITMIIALEEEFNIRFEDTQLVYDNYKTIGQLVSIIEQMLEKTKTHSEEK